MEQKNQKQPNNVVYLITTYKCSACKCMERILNSVKREIAVTFDLKVCDFNDAPEFIKNNIILTDFPLTVAMKDDVIKATFIGTKTFKEVSKLLRNIGY